MIFQQIAVYFHNGGPFMWGVLVALGFAIAVILERIIYYFLICRGNGRKLVFDIKTALSDSKIDVAQKLVGRRNSPLFLMLRIALERFQSGATIEKIQDSVEEIAVNEVPKMTKRLNYLTLIANITTLLGLLGTITGLQRCFASLGNVDAAQKAAMLASGISEALNTTAFGLGVAVVSMIFFTYLTNKKQALLQDIDHAVIRLVNYMKEKKE